jgi:hypothetical protein
VVVTELGTGYIDGSADSLTPISRFWKEVHPTTANSLEAIERAFGAAGEVAMEKHHAW